MVELELSVVELELSVVVGVVDVVVVVVPSLQPDSVRVPALPV